MEFILNRDFLIFFHRSSIKAYLSLILCKYKHCRISDSFDTILVLFRTFLLEISRKFRRAFVVAITNFYFLPYTEKQNLLGYRKIWLALQPTETVLRTDLSVDLTEKSVVSKKNWSVVTKTMSFLRQRTKSVETTEKSVFAKDLVRCLKNHEFFETTDQIFRAN
jgi:hypothetical protein